MGGGAVVGDVSSGTPTVCSALLASAEGKSSHERVIHSPTWLGVRRCSMGTVSSVAYMLAIMLGSFLGSRQTSIRILCRRVVDVFRQVAIMERDSRSRDRGGCNTESERSILQTLGRGATHHHIISFIWPRAQPAGLRAGHGLTMSSHAVRKA